MLLTDWARMMGLPIEAQRNASLRQVLRFAFGESYIIQMINYRVYEDRDLEVVLGIMRDEFIWHANTNLLAYGTNTGKSSLHPVVEVMGIGTSVSTSVLAKRDKLSLVVSVTEGWKSPAPPPNIEDVVETVRHAVTMFNLTGEWHSFSKDNL